MPRRRGPAEPELKVGGYALWTERARIVRVDAVDGGTARVEWQGALASGALVDLGTETCPVAELSALDV